MASIYWRNGVAWARATRNGVERRASLRTSDRKLAQRRLIAWINKIDGAEFGERATHTFDEAAARFIKEHLPTIKRRSADRYVVSITNLKPTFKGMDLTKIGSAALTDFVSRRRGDVNRQTKTRVRAATIRRDLHCLSSIIGLAIEWEWLETNPVGPFLKRQKRRGLRESASRTRYLSHGEEIAILANARPIVAEAIKFAIDTGLRKEEQFSRRWGHVDLARNEIKIEGSTSKNAKDRRVPLLPRARAVLLGKVRSDKVDFVFWHNGRGRVAGATDKRARRRTPRRMLTLDRGLKAAAMRAGVADVRWHDLRRTCGCRLLQDRRMSMEQVSKWLGHSSIAVTERAYAFLNVDHLHKAIEHAPALERPVIEGEVEVIG